MYEEKIDTTSYPSFPITDTADFECPNNCSECEKKFIEHLCFCTTLPDTGFNRIVIFRIPDSSKFKHKC